MSKTRAPSFVEAHRTSPTATRLRVRLVRTVVDSPEGSPQHRRVSSATSRRETLDALRGFAMLVVLVYHIHPTLLPGGFLGLDIFFVLSGYLITTLLLSERARTGAISMRRFFGRRIRRLWPASWMVLALVAVAGLFEVWTPDQQRGLPGTTTAAVLQLANWHQMNAGGYVDAFVAPSPLQHYWSLSLEEQFYLLWPPVLLVLLRWRPRVVFPTAVIAAMAASTWSVHVSDTFQRAYLGTDTRIGAILAGALLAWVLRSRPLEGFAPGTPRTLSRIAGAIAVAGMFALCFVLDIEENSMRTGGFLMLAALSLVATLGALNVPEMPRWMAPFAFVGRVSFCMYLVHWPLLVALAPDASMLSRWLVGGPVALALAVGLQRTIEQPFIQRRDDPVLRLSSAALVPVAVVALVISAPSEQTIIEEVEESLGEVADPVVPTTAVPETPTTGSGAETSRTTAPSSTLPPCIPENGDGRQFQGGSGPFDPSTIEEIADPSKQACEGQLVVLILGDSTGRGVANGIASIADARIQLWDRTTLGCSVGPERCDDWRGPWTEAVQTIRPDVVVLHFGIIPDFKGVQDPPFLTPEGARFRVEQLTGVVDVVRATGAEVFIVSPPTPITPQALFYCENQARNSNCDPAWSDAWRETVAEVAKRTGIEVLDVHAWDRARGGGAADRPDGLHYTGRALQENARWLINELVTRVRR